ncbi:hypothetical protein GCM10025867_41040 [Frondihabitans sucicola]|uniref:Uncharacterized protein n=1 Tax=Frondihabitans sucicola TaxID=1268041 RepID=A0ABM8GTS7_9MICO|nr:hypothetical protein [Frondihabitans sucicola]BDZ51863.1 hypothetical protein GCM10025867_41040 [Frondihabitans sucicola]
MTDPNTPAHPVSPNDPGIDEAARGRGVDDSGSAADPGAEDAVREAPEFGEPTASEGEESPAGSDRTGETPPDFGDSEPVDATPDVTEPAATETFRESTTEGAQDAPAGAAEEPLGTEAPAASSPAPAWSASVRPTSSDAPASPRESAATEPAAAAEPTAAGPAAAEPAAAGSPAAPDASQDGAATSGVPPLSQPSTTAGSATAAASTGALHDDSALRAAEAARAGEPLDPATERMPAATSSETGDLDDTRITQGPAGRSTSAWTPPPAPASPTEFAPPVTGATPTPYAPPTQAMPTSATTPITSTTPLTNLGASPAESLGFTDGIAGGDDGFTPEELAQRRSFRDEMAFRQKQEFAGINFGSGFFGWLAAVGLAGLLYVIAGGIAVASGLAQSSVLDGTSTKVTSSARCSTPRRCRSRRSWCSS